MRRRGAPTVSKNQLSAVLAWVDAVNHGGSCALRIDDLDEPRLKAGSEAAIREELAWLGLQFDPMPDGPRYPFESDAPAHVACRQKGREARYLEVLEVLRQAGAVYPCPLSGKAFRACLAAPHEGDDARTQLTEAERDAMWTSYRDEPTASVSWRFAAAHEPVVYTDEAFGLQSSPAQGIDDFIVWRRDGVPSYQLATVVDDFDLGVTRVVRGADLIESTLRQVALLRVLGWGEPAYKHLGLVHDQADQRMAKRFGSVGATELRAQGVDAPAILGWVYSSCTGEAWAPIADVHGLAARLKERPWSLAPVAFDAAQCGEWLL